MDSFNFSKDQLEILKEEGIDDESFPLLDDETILKIFPKAGPRLLFKKQFDKFKYHQALDQELLEPRQPQPLVLAQVPLLSCSSSSYSSSSDTITTCSDATIEYIDANASLNMSEIQEENISDFEDNGSSACSMPKRICPISKLFEEGLEKLLEKTIDGQIVLMKKENLNNDARQRLVKEIIHYLIGKLGVDGIKSYMLDAAAWEIKKLFKNEAKETYFIGYKKTQNVKRAARGKLWSRFVNVRNALRSAESKTVRKSPSPKALVNDKKDELEILATILEPKERVLTQRSYILKRSNLSVEELFDRYAALSTSLGPDLIESDFNSRFDGKCDIIYTKVAKLASAVLVEADSRKISVLTDKDIDPVLKALLTLPYLFTPVTLKNKRRSGNWRPSRSEVADSFILHVEKFEDLAEKKNERVQRLKQWNFTLQPFAALCGPLNDVKKFLIIINDVIYTFDSLIRTVDVLYKTFHALDIEYPYESAHVWQFLEEILYSMKTSVSNSSVSALISDINKYIFFRMPSCAFCLKTYNTRKSFVIHLKLIHSCSNNSKFNCGEINCHRNFPNLNFYLKHLNNHKIISNEAAQYKNKSYNTLQEKQPSTKFINTVSTEASTEKKCESPVNFEKPNYDKDDLKNCCDQNLLSLFCKLYARCTFNRKDVQTILTYLAEFLSNPIKILKNNFKIILTFYKIPEVDVQEILKQFDIFEYIFSCYDSEHLRFKFLKETGRFVEPVGLKIGERFEGSQNISVKSVTIQYIPITKVLKNFFEMPRVFEETMSYLEQLQNSKDGLTTNIIQTSFWKNKVSKYNLKKNTIPILVYFDDYEVGNPLGSHAGIHKLGAVYFSVATFPLIFQSQLENIFLALLFHSSDFKKHGPNTIFSKLINDLNEIEVNGININVDKKEHIIYFSVALILGDNLGLYTMLGFTESFSSNFCCRFCKCPKITMQRLCKQDTSTLRNKTNYEDDLKTSSVSLTGVKTQSVWNNLRSFHVTENYVVDIMHDIFEGIAEIVIMKLIHQFVKIDKLFTLETLNFKLKHFEFGREISNRPPLISEDNLKNKRINMSASEMKCFILYAGVIFGPFVPIGNEYWKIYILFIKVLHIVLSKYVTQSDCNNLNCLVEQLTSLYLKLFSNNLTPKFHHLLHYGLILSKTGPVINFSSFRYEAKHRKSKLSSNVVASRVNITKTLAVKHQLIQTHTFLMEKGFTSTVLVHTGIKNDTFDGNLNLKDLFLLSDISLGFDCSSLIITDQVTFTIRCTS